MKEQSNEPVSLEKYGYASGYTLYPDGRIWSDRVRKRGGAFLTLDRTGCTKLKTSSGEFVRRSPALLAFNEFTKKRLISEGYEPAFGGDVFINMYGDAYSSITGKKLIPNVVKQYAYIHAGGKDRLLHRVVAETFIPNPNNLPEVDHIDGDKSDNSAFNLRWVTRSENMKYAYENGALDVSLDKAISARWRKTK